MRSQALMAVLLVALAGCEPEDEAPPPVGPPPAPPVVTGSAAADPNEQAPPEAQWEYTYPTGRWVYLADQGWVWIPVDADVNDEDGVPYVYLYTPLYGWTWFVSPWGWGPYRYGLWVRRPWRAWGWRGRWVAHPHSAPHFRHGGGGHRR